MDFGQWLVTDIVDLVVIVLGVVVGFAVLTAVVGLVAFTALVGQPPFRFARLRPIRARLLARLSGQPR